MKVIILKGLPGSGKSTYAKQFVKENRDYVRINRDDLRNMRGEYWLPKQEDLITSWEHDTIVNALQHGYNVILDSTNLNKRHINHLIDSVKNGALKDVEFEEKFFDVPVDECIKRDLARPNSVGEEVIRRMYEQYICPPAVYKESRALFKAVLVDIDGTLAKMNGRGPFDWMRVGEDKVNEPVADLVRTLHESGKSIILMSGRDGSCYDITKQWLHDNDIPFFMLLMRPAGNNQKDSIIKKRLFEENIRGKYYVEFILDDRDQVVRMWRKELGLTCLQVDYGNF